MSNGQLKPADRRYSSSTFAYDMTLNETTAVELCTDAAMEVAALHYDFVPFDKLATKLSSKAAIDVVCNPLGKSGGALIQQFMILGFGSLAASTPYLGIILLGIVLAWLNAAASLNTQFVALAAENEELKSELA